MTKTNVIICGAGGRMGQLLVACAKKDPSLEITGTVGDGDDLNDVISRADVVVDFTIPDTALANVKACLAAGVHVVVGTTGFDLDAARAAAEASSAKCFVAPNFAIGAVLLMMVAQTIAPHMPECEVIELHHDRKLDAPSGTAKRTQELIDAAVQHAVAVHSHTDSPQLREQIAALIKSQ